MGAVCYKPKPTTISKEEVLRALNDKHLRETITEPDGGASTGMMKTFKTDENNSNKLVKEQVMCFGNMSLKLNREINEKYKGNRSNSSTNIGNNSPAKTINQQPLQSKNHSSTLITNTQQPTSKTTTTNTTLRDSLELNILTYFGTKDDIYQTLLQTSRKTLHFMRKHYKTIESQHKIKHSNEKIRFIQVKSIEEHQSGVNQLLKISPHQLVTASDDCYLKFWQATTMKVETSIPTETITCIALTGINRDILVAGCHSGNLLLISVPQKVKKEQITAAHYNLIRVIVSLEALKNKFFVTADVCGIVKVWTSLLKSTPVLEIEQEGAISYNSMIELMDVLPKRYEDSNAALIACALKSQKINLILLLPSATPQPTFQLLKTLRTSMKPTCLIQLTPKHLAIAVGSLKEESCIEIHKILSDTTSPNKAVTAYLRGIHKDMIDSMYRLENLPSDKLKSNNKYITWFLSASRDRQIVLWKLIDGRAMRRNLNNLINSNKKQQQLQQQQQQVNNGVRSFADIKKGSNTNNISALNGVQMSGSRRKKTAKTPKSQNQHHRRQSDDQGDFEDGDQNNEDQESALDEEDDDEQEDDYDNDNNEANAGIGKNGAAGNEEEEEKTPKMLKGSSSSKTIGNQQQEKMIDYYYAFDTGHKDFVRSMAQINNGNVLVTASEDKTIKIFTIAF